MEIIKPVKHGGRKKGTPNRLTKEVRAVLKEVVFNEMLEVETHFEKLDPKTRIELLIKLMPYVCPKIGSESFNLNEPIDFNFYN